MTLSTSERDYFDPTRRLAGPVQSAINMRFPFFFSNPRQNARRRERPSAFTPIGISAPVDGGSGNVEPADTDYSWDTIIPVGSAAATAPPVPAAPAAPDSKPASDDVRPINEPARPAAGQSANPAHPSDRPLRSGGNPAGIESGPPDGSIGAILVASRRLSIADARRVVVTQAESPLPFGEAAIRLGVITPEDVEYALSQQFFMPRLQPGDPAVDPEVAAAFDPDHAIVPHLRDLRSQITRLCLHATPALRSVAIMSVERRAGRSFLAANLATVFAQLGARTLLLDADLVHPRQHLLFRLDNRAGLSSILAGRAGLGAVRPVPGLSGFAVLPAGPRPPNPHDLMARPQLEKLLRRCERDFDVVILDTPNWRAGSGARMAAASAGAAILLVAGGRTGAVGALQVSQEITASGSRLVGAVLNRPR